MNREMSDKKWAEKTLETIKRGKSSGPGGLLAELLKYEPNKL